MEKSQKIRRLADAITELLRHPITVRLSDVWYAASSEASIKQLPRKYREQHARENKRYENAKARREELKASFNDARLLLNEDEAVFLERTLNSLPDLCTYASAKGEYLESDELDQLGEIAHRLRFRADFLMTQASGGSFPVNQQSVTSYLQTGFAWQIMTCLQLGPSAWKGIKDTISPVVSSSRKSQWRLQDFIDKGHLCKLALEELEAVFAATSPTDLKNKHPEIAHKIRRTS